MSFDRRVAIGSINEVIQKINDNKNILANDYDRIINRYFELKSVYINISWEMSIKENEETMRNDGFTGPAWRAKFGDKYSTIGLIFEPNQECEIRSVVIMARDKLIEAINSFTHEVISKFPKLEIIQDSVNKFIDALVD